MVVERLLIVTRLLHLRDDGDLRRRNGGHCVKGRRWASAGGNKGTLLKEKRLCQAGNGG